MIPLKKLLSITILKKWGPWALSFFLVIGLLLLMRTCSYQSNEGRISYSIGRNTSWYPLQLLGNERNLTAFTNDLMEKIANTANIQFEWVEANPSSLLEGLNNGSYNAIVSTLRPNVVNQEKYVFSERLFDVGPVLIVQQDSPITSLKQMHKLYVGVSAGASVTFNAIREHGANVYDLNIVIYENINKALEAMSEDKIDGIIIDALPAYTLTAGYFSGKLKVVTAPLTDEGLRLIALKMPASEIRINDFNIALRTLKEKDVYDALLLKWNLINPEKQYLPPLTEKTIP